MAQWYSARLQFVGSSLTGGLCCVTVQDTLYPQFSTSSAQETSYDLKFVDCGVFSTVLSCVLNNAHYLCSFKDCISFKPV